MLKVAQFMNGFQQTAGYLTLTRPIGLRISADSSLIQQKKSNFFK